MISIEVIGRDGRGLANADVQISWSNWTHSTGRTDRNGYVSWDVSSGSGTIYVNRDKVYDGYIDGSLRIHAG